MHNADLNDEANHRTPLALSLARLLNTPQGRQDYTLGTGFMKHKNTQQTGWQAIERLSNSIFVIEGRAKQELTRAHMLKATRTENSECTPKDSASYSSPGKRLDQNLEALYQHLMFAIQNYVLEGATEHSFKYLEAVKKRFSLSLLNIN